MLNFSFSMSFGQVSGLCLRGLSLGVGVGRRQISVSAVPLGPGVAIWRTCRFRVYERVFSLSDLGQPLSNQAHQEGEERSRTHIQAQGESTSEGLLLLLRYPPRFAVALLEGTLPLRYCAGRFASGVPTWSLPSLGRGHGISGRL